MQYDDFDDEFDLMGDDDELVDLIEEQAVLMGFDTTDPELMGGFLRRLAKRIGDRVRARRARRAGGSSAAESSLPALPDLQSLTSPMPTTAMVPTSAPSGGAADMMKNPMVLGGAALALFMLMKMKKK